MYRCEKIYGRVSHELIGQLFLGKMDRAQLSDYVCVKLMKKVKGACGKDRPVVPATRVSGGDNFVGKGKAGRIMDEINQEMRETHPDFMAPKHMIDEL
jgi:hypothetical protein